MISKNKRSILHKIVVYDYPYHWCAVDYNKDGTCMVKIWKDYDKIFEDVIQISNSNVKMVRAKIKFLIDLK